MNHYFLRRAGRVDGPWPLERLLSEVRNKKLSKFHELSTDGQEWFKAEALADLFAEKKLPERFRKPVAIAEAVDTFVASEPEPVVPSPPGQQRVWYLAGGDEPSGPFTTTEVRAMYLSGQMESDLIWKEGLADWMQIHDVGELQDVFSPSARNLQSSIHSVSSPAIEVGQQVGPVVTQPAGSVSWSSVFSVGLVFLIVLSGMFALATYSSWSGKQDEREFFANAFAEDVRIRSVADDALKRQDIGEYLNQMKLLEWTFRSYNISKLEPRVQQAVIEYADSIAEYIRTVQGLASLDSAPAVLAGMIETYVRARQGDTFGPLLDQIRLREGAKQEVDDAVTNMFRRRAELAALAPK